MGRSISANLKWIARSAIGWIPDAQSFSGYGRPQTHTCRTRDTHETHRKVGKLTFNFAGSSRSPPAPKLWKQSAKRGYEFSWLSGSWAALPGIGDGRLYGSPTDQPPKPYQSLLESFNQRLNFLVSGRRRCLNT